MDPAIEMSGGYASVVNLIVRCLVESDGETVDSFSGNATHQADNGATIRPAAQESARLMIGIWITAQQKMHRLFDGRAQQIGGGGDGSPGRGQGAAGCAAIRMSSDVDQRAQNVWPQGRWRALCPAWNTD